MSDTQAAKPAVLVSSSPATQSTAAASAGTSAAVMVIISWLLGLAHVAVPPEVAAAVSALLAPAIHWAVIKYGIPTE